MLLNGEQDTFIVILKTRCVAVCLLTLGEEGDVKNLVTCIYAVVATYQSSEWAD